MFKSLKSKILAISIVMLTFLMLVFLFHTMISRMKTKQLMVQNYGFSIEASFLNDINERIVKLEDNLKSLALIGNLFYRTDRSYELTDRVITRIFENYPETLGGGIWFKPYALDKNKKYVCFYAYRDKNNKIVIDKNFSSESYDYPNQEWYKQIISKVTPDRNIVWTKPYFENQGSYTTMVTAGTGIYVDGELVGVATVDWEISSVMNEISKMKPFARTFSMYKSGREIKNSFALLGNPEDDYILATSDPYLDNITMVGHSLKEIPWYAKDLYGKTYIEYRGKIYIPFARKLHNGMVLIICIPKSAMFKSVNIFYYLTVVFVLFLISLMLAFVFFGMNRYIIHPIDKLIEIAQKISKGENVKIKIDKPEEFVQLASTFDSMTKDIKSITKEKEKINSELAIAKSIQTSTLPDIFPPFPDRTDFDIYASMIAAKEVGGDFYDFYFIDDNHFMFLIADVSGKGIPAALFMMTAKTLISNMAQITNNPKELIKLINNKICSNNKHGLFITMFVGIVDVSTGKMSCINCGHNQPLIKQNNGEYRYLELNTNCVLGIMEDADFEITEVQLQNGDIIFTYTDGITEAFNSNDEMYGESRLAKCLNQTSSDNLKNLIYTVQSSVKEFTGDVSQSDDLTMLVFKYGQKNYDPNLKTFTSYAIPVNYKKFYFWLHNVCNEWNLSDELKMKLDMCSEEIYANIQFYAYDDTGMIEVQITNRPNGVEVVFKDNGKQYDPLKKDDPDITLPPEERPIGGLGIYMVKQIADQVRYQYKDGKNILTLLLSKDNITF